MNFFELIEKLDDFHQKQLMWAHQNKGNIVPFTQIQKLKFVIQHKGIYKPKGWKYAISVSKRLGSNYEDGEVTYDSTGAWKVNYKPESNLSEFTNKALIKNQRDLVPLVFFDQVSKKPQKSTYKIVGTCLPQFEKKYIEFLLFGFDDEGKINDLI
jgi:hypothetical protein